MALTKIKSGGVSSSIALDSPDINTPDIDGGTIDGTVIGGATPAAISGTTGQFATSLNVDGTITADGLNLGDASVLNVGTIALDTIKGDADDNTNITFAGSDTTTFTQGGTQRLAVNTSGISVTGEVAATSLDISGNIDVDGTVRHKFKCGRNSHGGWA